MLQVASRRWSGCSCGTARSNTARCTSLFAARRCFTARTRCEVDGDGPRYKPAYNKYRTRQKIDSDVIKEWKYVTGTTSPRVPLRPWTLAFSFAGIIKFYLLPEQLRFVFFLAWTFIKGAGILANKCLVLEGAKLDAKIAQMGSGGSSKVFSRAMVLRRWHGRISPWANLQYRLQLWRGVPLPEAFAAI